MNLGDGNFRSQFKDLKAADARDLRSFSSFWETARQSGGRNRRGSLNIPAIAVAMVFLLIAAASVYFHSTRTASINRVSQWRSPTAFLLRTSGDRLFTGTPRWEISPVQFLRSDDTK